jgi:hypothetical protein
MRRDEILTVYYHCNEEYPQIISSFNQVSSEKDYEYPETPPVVVTFRQKVSYLDAELKEHIATKTIRYFLGKEEDAERVITHPEIYKVLNPIDFYENCYDGTMVTYKTPSGKVYTIPKSNYVKAFETKEELQAGVDRFITRFLNLKDTKENASTSKSPIDSPKVYTK